jgi:hypothetical protein
MIRQGGVERGQVSRQREKSRYLQDIEMTNVPKKRIRMAFDSVIQSRNSKGRIDVVCRMKIDGFFVAG